MIHIVNSLILFVLELQYPLQQLQQLKLRFHLNKGIGYFAIKNSGIKHTKLNIKHQVLISLVLYQYIRCSIPGLIPGMPPYFLKFSAVSFGLKTIDV